MSKARALRRAAGIGVSTTALLAVAVAFAFDPLTLWLLGKLAVLVLGGAAVAGVIYVASLSINTIRSWFNQRTRQTGDLKRVIAQKMSSDKFRVVVGWSSLLMDLPSFDL